MKQLPRLSAQLLLLGVLASPGCTVQITNPLVNIDPQGLRTPGPLVTPGPGPTPEPPRPDQWCREFGPDAPTIVFPKPELRACPRIHPPPPGCDEATRSPYGVFAGLRAPASFAALKDEAAIRNHIDQVLWNGDAVSGGEKYVGSCLRDNFPDLYAAFELGRPKPEPSFIPEPWFPEPCLAGPSQTVTVSGMVFDGQGTPFASDVEVRVSTADFSFNATSQVVDGRWEVTGAPAGARLQATAVHLPSGESRRRFVVPQAAYADCGQEGFATVNFGGRTSDADPLGPRYAMGVSAPEVQRRTTGVTVLVYDVAGRPLPNATVALRALDAGLGYAQQMTTADGSTSQPLFGQGVGVMSGDGSLVLVSDNAQVVLGNNGVASPDGKASRLPVQAVVFEGVPADVPLELKASVPGHLEQVRLLDPLPANRRHRFAFGGPVTRTDPMAPQYALVPVPQQPVEDRVTVAGKVLRQDNGAPVADGRVRLAMEAGETAFQQETRLGADGTYRFEGVPARSRATLTVEAPGYEPVVRLVRIGKREGATFNFGGANTKTDPLAASFGLVELGK